MSGQRLATVGATPSSGPKDRSTTFFYPLLVVLIQIHDRVIDREAPAAVDGRSISPADTGASLRVGKPHRIEGNPPTADVGLDDDATCISKRYGGFTDLDDGRGRAIDHAKFVIADEESDLFSRCQRDLGGVAGRCGRGEANLGPRDDPGERKDQTKNNPESSLATPKKRGITNGWAILSSESRRLLSQII